MDFIFFHSILCEADSIYTYIDLYIYISIYLYGLWVWLTSFSIYLKHGKCVSWEEPEKKFAHRSKGPLEAGPNRTKTSSHQSGPKCGVNVDTVTVNPAVGLSYILYIYIYCFYIYFTYIYIHTRIICIITIVGHTRNTRSHICACVNAQAAREKKKAKAIAEQVRGQNLMGVLLILFGPKTMEDVTVLMLVHSIYFCGFFRVRPLSTCGR